MYAASPIPSRALVSRGPYRLFRRRQRRRDCEFDRNGEVTFTMDRPPEISHGFEFPEVLSYAVVNDYVLFETPTEDPILYRIHSLGTLVVFERGEKVPWILVPVTE